MKKKELYKILDELEAKRKTSAYINGHSFSKQSPYKDIKDKPQRRVDNTLPVAEGRGYIYKRTGLDAIRNFH